MITYKEYNVLISRGFQKKKKQKTWVIQVFLNFKAYSNVHMYIYTVDNSEKNICWNYRDQSYQEKQKDETMWKYGSDVI